ncbi:MAG: ABC transporter ATP-binding protein [Candidatus Diapherotrites archaeon CG08_land_8_20_14_0_20_34_12]|nr:MAG: ABC transporter ATP-binding protein [Candidatus Diapherotrites archaeon CG08_land_8_20_14_0_20_34_12]
MAYAIETDNLTKKFSDLTAVDNVSLKVNEGEIFGLLGPNGAGKTTLISMLVTLKKPTSGTAKVNGFDIHKNPDGVRKSIGIIFQDPSLDEELTAFENLELHAAMYGISKAEREKRIIEVIETVELKDRLNTVVKTFSGGMRRRLEIARALLHYPKVLFLDEPTIGLDPQTRKHVWDYIKKLKEEHGITILLTTHYMDEADSLCDRIAIIDQGKVIVLDSGKALKDSLGGDTLKIETNQAEKLQNALKGMKGVKDTKILEGRLQLRVEFGEKKILEVVEAAKKNNIEILSVGLHKPTIDDVFLHYTGKTIREETLSGKDQMRMRRKAWGHKR